MCSWPFHIPFSLPPPTFPQLIISKFTFSLPSFLPGASPDQQCLQQPTLRTYESGGPAADVEGEKRRGR